MTCLRSLSGREQNQLLNLHNFLLSHYCTAGYPEDSHERIKEALTEAWVWLEREGYLAPKPGSSDRNWVFITKRGIAWLDAIEATEKSAVANQDSRRDISRHREISKAPENTPDITSARARKSGLDERDLLDLLSEDLLSEFLFAPTVRIVLANANKIAQKHRHSPQQIGTSALLFGMIEAGRQPGEGDTTAQFLFNWIVTHGESTLLSGYEDYQNEEGFSPRSRSDLITRNVMGVLEKARDIAKATENTPIIHGRHLLGSLLIYEPNERPLGAFQRLSRMGFDLLSLRVEFRNYLRELVPSLIARRSELVKTAADHNSKCSAVPKDTPEWKSCSDAQTELETERKQYIDAVNRFNLEVEQAICAQVAHLQNQFESLTQQIGLDRQVIKNFGFEKTVEEIEYWGNLPTRQVEDAKSAFKTLLLDAILDSVSEAAGAVGSLTSDEVDALNRLAGAQGAPPLGIVAGAKDLHKSLDFLDKTKGAYEAADAVKRAQILETVIKLGGLASNNHAFGLLLSADGWAAYQVYQSATAMTAVRDLTKTNERDLILLKSRSEKLKAEVDQFTGVKKQLAELDSKCDSTKLVKKPE